MLSFGLIGAGRIGVMHGRNLAYRVPGARLTHVADTNLDAARELAETLGLPAYTTEAAEIFGDPSIDAVFIASSTDTHSDFIQAAAAAGKHIFSEKPIDLALPQIDAAIEAVEATGVKCHVGFNRRFDANFRRIHQAIRDGDVGETRYIQLVSRDPAPPPVEYIERSGGIFLDQTIHDFDMARFLAGSEVERVYATGRVTVDPAIGEAGDYDTVVAMLEFENGVVATVDNCRQCAYGYDQRVEVFGSKGAANASNSFENEVEFRTDSGISRDKPYYFFISRYHQSYIDQVVDFVDAVENDRPVSVSARDAKAPVLIGMAATRSAKEGRPVRLDEFA